MSETKLGQLIDASAKRDAIHVAVAPVVADEELAPGEHVGFVSDDRERVGTASGNLFGIVDPFLKASVAEGQRFFVCLYPQTVTSLRHAWTHPAFQPEDPNDERATSEHWLRAYAEAATVSYERLMDAATDAAYPTKDRWPDPPIVLNVDVPKLPPIAEFWKHFEIVTGKKPADPERYLVACSCN